MHIKRLSNKAVLLILVSAVSFLVACNNNTRREDQQAETTTSITDPSANQDSTAYKTEYLIVSRLSDHVYVHTSFLDTEDFGRVPCNGMIVVNDQEAVVFDTPANRESSEELITYITEKLNSQITAVVATHFHADCVAGLEEFHANNIPSYAHQKTPVLLKSIGRESPQPQNTFEDILTLAVGAKKVYAVYFGEGHTKDNVVAYFPENEAIFGGCLIKEVGAQKGNLADANLNDWSETVKKIKKEYPEAKIVIPGHGKAGGIALLDYTIELFEK